MFTRSICLFTLCSSLLITIKASAENSQAVVFTDQEMTCEVLPLFRELWNGSILEDPGSTERAAWIVREPDGKLASVKWPYLGARLKITWKYQVPRQALAQVHTHPRKASPQPSDEDHRQASRLGLPFYVITRKGIWVALPDGGTAQVSGSGWAKQPTAAVLENCDHYGSGLTKSSRANSAN